MKILWITNILFPEAQAKLLANETFTLKGGGGWLIGAAESLIEQPGVELHIATVSHIVHDLKIISGKKINYIIIPFGKGNLIYNPEYESYWHTINNNFKPDIIHIHGSEFTHGLAFVNNCGNKNVVLSIQGLKSAYYPYYYSGLSKYDIYTNLTLHDLIKGTIIKEKRNFKKTGEFEKELISKVRHIIGRTSWDRTRVWAINPNAKYHFCNETLRPEFYIETKWEYDKCEKHTIFLSQAGYAIKGLHMILRAMPLVLNNYPNAKIRIAGPDITRSNGIWGLKHFSGYGKIIKKMILKFNLNEKITFIGNLNANEMIQEYIKSNVFVCPSSIENSPNSLGEAQILGVPCIVSYVGGTPDMMMGNEDNLYRFEEIEMLAKKICDVFYAREKHVNMINQANIRHDKVQNAKILLDIYSNIIKS